MDPFLSVVASAFPGRAGILQKSRQSPKAAIPIGQRAERGEGPAIIPTTAVEKVCSLQITSNVGHSRSSSFSMKKKDRSPLRSADLRPPFPSPSLRRAFPLMVREFSYLNLAGILSSLTQIGSGFALNIGSNMI